MENKYANTLLESIDNIKFGLKYYIERCLELENELKVYRKRYENRVNEYIKLLKENEELKEELETEQNERLLCYIKERQMIPVQKIKGKIENLKMSGGSDGKDNTENTARELAIEALQDILEESEK
ncbi:MAG: hypothetical protein SPI94_04665 [Candidatus Onthovivens sp.]|nr:hypothetical protein [Candidatus Onthovivens sp.]